MTTKLGMKTLGELQAENLPRCDWRELMSFSTTGGSEPALTPDDIQALDDYFSHFLKPGKCVMCEANLGGKDPIDGFLRGATFTWGLQHGVGFCRDCKYPARAYHYDVGPIKRFEMILQFHPAELSQR